MWQNKRKDNVAIIHIVVHVTLTSRSNRLVPVHKGHRSAVVHGRLSIGKHIPSNSDLYDDCKKEHRNISHILNWWFVAKTRYHIINILLTFYTKTELCEKDSLIRVCMCHWSVVVPQLLESWNQVPGPGTRVIATGYPTPKMDNAANHYSCVLKNSAIWQQWSGIRLQQLTVNTGSQPCVRHISEWLARASQCTIQSNLDNVQNLNSLYFFAALPEASCCCCFFRFCGRTQTTIWLSSSHQMHTFKHCWNTWNR